LVTEGPAARLAELDAVVAALAHPARRQILLTIRFRGGVLPAGDIAKRFAHAWPTTTRHLRVLEEAGLITSERQGRKRLYRLDLSKLSALDDYLAWLRTGRPPAKGKKADR